MKIKEIQAKSILNRSGISEYCINPYTGCQIGCVYCYARLFMKRYSGHKEPWGRFVDAKVNAAEALARQLKRAKPGRVWISSVCDPYQPLEAAYRLTRQCLLLLRETRFPVTVQTKSHMVLRDLDLFGDFEDIEVGLTVATDDERVAAHFEPGASPIRQRLEALAILHRAGIRTFAFIGPILPGNPTRLAASLEGNVDRVLADRMNYISSIRAFYGRIGHPEACSDDFFRDYRETLMAELNRRKIPYEMLF